MSAEGVLHAVVTSAIGAVAGLNRTDPGRPVKATPPCAEVGAIAASDWGTKDRAGREVRLSVVVRDLAERADRLHVLSGAVQAAIEAMPRVSGGWRIVSLAFVKSRIASEKAGNWVSSVEYRARMLIE